MIKLFFLAAIILVVCPVAKADQPSLDDRQFLEGINTVKNPFDDGLPKPVIVEAPVKPKPKPIVIVPKLKPKPEAPPPDITLPSLTLQGVVVGGDVQNAIINNQVVILGTFIEGAQVESINKQGVELLFRGKKFFLKVD